ncbi:MAG: carbonic anhydrase/acetyltransferase-like protein (isoleucine patch superfamily), partial [Alphaproteobacteria bacterium]
MSYPLTPDAMPIILAYRGVVPRIADDAFVAAGATVIGDVEIGTEASIWFGCVLRGDEHSIKIGARSNLQDGTVVHVSGRKQGTYIGA